MAVISATGSNGHHTFRLYTTESNIRIPENDSRVNWNFTIQGQSGWDFYGIYATVRIIINNQTVHNVNASRDYDGSGNEYSWASGSLIVPHNADGSKTVSISFQYIEDNTLSYTPGDASSSGSMTLTKINRYAVTNSVTGSDIEQLFSVNYTKYLDTYKYKLRISIPNVAQLERIDDYVSDTQISLSQTTIEDLYTQFTTQNTFTLGFRIETWNSAGTEMLSAGNEKTITAKITGALPIFTDFDFEDVNATTLALTDNNKYIINGYSSVKVTISTVNKAEAQKGATITNYRVIIGSKTLDIPYSDSSSVYGTISNVENGTIQVYAMDSRGNSTPVTKLATQEIQYTPITLSLNSSYVERDDGGLGDGVELTYSGTIWNNSFGDVTNSITLAKYEYREVDSQTWITPTNMTDITPTISQSGGLSFSGSIASDETGHTFDLQKSYVFRLTLEDELSSYQITLSPLSSAIPNISLNKNGVGIMCDYDETLGGLLQVGGEVYGEQIEYYSTSEVKTHKVWVNDKPIYRKCFYISSFPNNTIIWITTGISNLDEVIFIGGYEKNSSEMFSINAAYGTSYFDSLVYEISGGNAGKIRIKTTSNRSGYSGYVWIEYTKTTN